MLNQKLPELGEDLFKQRRPDATILDNPQKIDLQDCDLPQEVITT